MSPASAKICVVCGKDCAGSPRVKDPGGRYFCKPCYDEALERKKAAKVSAAQDAVADEDDFDLDDSAVPDFGKPLFDDEEEDADVDSPPRSKGGGKPCPNCGLALEQGAILCINCGYNVEEGKLIAPQVVDDEVSAAASTKWPLVIGIVSLVFAAPGGLVYAFASLGAVFQSPADAGGAFAWAFNMVIFPILTALSIGLGVAGVALIMRKPSAPSWMRWWAMAKIAVSIAFAAGVLATLGAQTDAMVEAGMPAEMAGFGIAFAVIALLFLLALFIAWPIFILLWFRRQKIKAEVEGWTSA